MSNESMATSRAEVAQSVVGLFDRNLMRTKTEVLEILNERPTMAFRIVQFVKIWDRLEKKGGIEIQNFATFLDLKSREE